MDCNCLPGVEEAQGLFMLWDAAFKTGHGNKSDDVEDKTEDQPVDSDDGCPSESLSVAITTPPFKRLRSPSPPSSHTPFNSLSDDCVVRILERLAAPPVAANEWPAVLRSHHTPYNPQEALKCASVSKRIHSLVDASIWRLRLGDRCQPMLDLDWMALTRCLPRFAHLRYLELQHCCVPQWGVLLSAVAKACPSLISVEFSVLRSKGSEGGDCQRGLQRDDLDTLFRGCKRLESITLDDCLRHHENDEDCPIPESIFALSPTLDRFYISKLPSPSTFLASVHRLVQLRHLELHEVNILEEFPPSIAALPMLETLVIADAHSLHSLPSSLGDLGSLRKLRLCNIPNLSNLPNSITRLVHLKELEITCCDSLSFLPNAIGELKSLQSLLIMACSQLTNLPPTLASFSTLRCLALPRCPSLRMPVWLPDLLSLEFLSLRESEWLTYLPAEIADIGPLRVMDVSDCYALKALPPSLLRRQRMGLRILSSGNGSSMFEFDPMAGALVDKEYAVWYDCIEKAL